MGNTTSKEKSSFGSIYPDDNTKARPGYYFNKNIKRYQGEPIEVLEGETDFIKLKHGYAKSNKRVFYRGVTISNANPVTFDIVNRKNISKKLTDKELIKKLKNLNSVIGMDFDCNTKRFYHKGNFIYCE